MAVKTLGEHRRAAGLSQSQLSEKSGVSLRTLQALESGERSIGKAQLNTVLPLARALGLTVEELAGYIGERNGEKYYVGDFKWFGPEK